MIAVPNEVLLIVIVNVVLLGVCAAVGALRSNEDTERANTHILPVLLVANLGLSLVFADLLHTAAERLRELDEWPVESAQTSDEQ